MTKRFTQKQLEAVEEKVEQLKKIRDGTMTAGGLGKLTERRMGWFRVRMFEIGGKLK